MVGTNNTPWRNSIVGDGEESPEQLLAHPQNPKIHPGTQQAALSGALSRVGWLTRVIVNQRTGHVLDGHARVAMAISRGERLVPVSYVDVDPADEALVLATFDPIGAMAVTDAAMFDELLKDIETDDQAILDMLETLSQENHLSSAGSGAGTDGGEGAANEDEGEDAEDEGPAAQIDRAAELQTKWATASGQLWRIPSLSVEGQEHRLLIGDARDMFDVGRLCSEGVQNIFTSPPYAEQRAGEYEGAPADSYVKWWDTAQSAARSVLAPNGSFFVNIKAHCEKGQRHTYVMDLVLAMIRDWQWKYLDELCWERASIPGNMGPRFKNEWEPVHHFSVNLKPKFRPTNVLETDTDLSKAKTYDQTDGSVTLGKDYAGKGGEFVKSKNFDGALPGNVVRVSRGFSANPGHGAVFPVGLPTFFVRAYSDPGDTWGDFFAGSGTVGVACEREGRLSRLMEKRTDYAAVILERLFDMGLRPVLDTETAAQ